MRAILLAAGLGQRLRRPEPKCLLRFGGRSLLVRHLEALHALGVKDVVLALGYRAQEVRAELEALGPPARPVTVINPDFERGSVVSLWAAREHLMGGGDVLVMDADVLYDERILDRLLMTPGNVFLLDREYDDAGDEAVKLCVRDGLLVEFRKQVARDLVFDFAGESVGFFRFDQDLARELAERCDRYVQEERLDAPHEEVIRDLLLEGPERFRFEDVTGLPWIEIDFPEDVSRAEQEVLPRLAEERS